MTLSVDDLVSSFSSNHIGQEALDIAALQAQLSQTLLACSASNGRDLRRASSRPCNTPTSCNPSASSVNWDYTPLHDGAARDETLHDGDEIDQDERMVEDLLLSSSPTSPSSPQPPFSFPPYAYRHHRSSSTSHSCATEASSSLFPSTDPFYNAQLQAAQNYNSPPPSLFAQAGHPAQHSPFLLNRHSQPAHYQFPHCEGHGYISGAAISVGRQSHP